MAAWNGQLEVARILLDEAEVDINDHQFEGVSPLGFAISKGDYATASLLLSRGSSRRGHIGRVAKTPRRRDRRTP